MEKENTLAQKTVNQHYVPRFYMKPFSVLKNEGTRKEKTFISFCQFKNGMINDGIPTHSICSKGFFYDNDGSIENKLAEKESKKWAPVLKKFCAVSY